MDEVVPSHAGVIVGRGASAFLRYSRGQVHLRDSGLPALGTMGCAVSGAKEKRTACHGMGEGFGCLSAGEGFWASRMGYLARWVVHRGEDVWRNKQGCG